MNFLHQQYVLSVTATHPLEPRIFIKHANLLNNTICMGFIDSSSTRNKLRIYNDTVNEYFSTVHSTNYMLYHIYAIEKTC